MPASPVAALNEELRAAQVLQTDDLLRGVLSGCGDCIKVLDLEGRLQFMSEGGKRVMEVDDFSLLKGCPWPDFWEGAGNTDAKAAVAAAIRGESARFKGAANTAKGTPRFWDVQVSPIFGADGTATHVLSISKDITEEHQAAERQRFLTDELHHRIKNTLTTVLAIANSSFRGEVHQAARAAFTSRIMAMDKANTVLRETAWRPTPVRLTVENALTPHRSGEGRFALAGLDIDIKPHQSLALALAVNELATNAIKYGSLSANGGTVDIGWSVETLDGVKHFVFRWVERGGPPVAEPIRKGFGTRVIQTMLASEFAGSVDVSYAAAGLTCTLRTPLANLTTPAV